MADADLRQAVARAIEDAIFADQRWSQVADAAIALVVARCAEAARDEHGKLPGGLTRWGVVDQVACAIEALAPQEPSHD